MRRGHPRQGVARENRTVGSTRVDAPCALAQGLAARNAARARQLERARAPHSTPQPRSSRRWPRTSTAGPTWTLRSRSWAACPGRRWPWRALPCDVYGAPGGVCGAAPTRGRGGPGGRKPKRTLPHGAVVGAALPASPPPPRGAGKRNGVTPWEGTRAAHAPGGHEVCQLRNGDWSELCAGPRLHALRAPRGDWTQNRPAARTWKESANSSLTGACPGPWHAWSRPQRPTRTKSIPRPSGQGSNSRLHRRRRGKLTGKASRLASPRHWADAATNRAKTRRTALPPYPAAPRRSQPRR